MQKQFTKIPKIIEPDIKKAIKILKQIGFKDLYIFGSHTKGNYTEDSDIDFAIRGLPDSKYFFAIGKLDMELEHKFDLINLDKTTNFNKLILEKEELLKIA